MQPYSRLMSPASALGNLGQIGAAGSVINEALQQEPDLSVSYLDKTLPTKRPAELEPFLDDLVKAGQPE